MLSLLTLLKKDLETYYQYQNIITNVNQLFILVERLVNGVKLPTQVFHLPLNQCLGLMRTKLHFLLQEL